MATAEKLRVAWLCDRKYHETKMSRCRFSYASAIQQHPDVECLFTGNGIMSYDESLSVSENLKRMNFAPDVILSYKPEDHIQFREAKALKVLSYNETYWSDNRAVNECTQHKADLVICHHEGAVDQLGAFGIHAVHIPHCVPLSVFTPGIKASERPVSLLVTGALAETIYPLRTRIAAMIQGGSLPGHIKRHPGYRLPDKLTCDRQYQDYASALRMARISAVCSSAYGYAVAKFVESFASGCVVLGDLPDDSLFTKAFGEWLVGIDVSDSGMAIAEVVKSLLSSPQEMDRLAAGGRKAAEQFSVERYANDFVDHCRKALFF